MGQIADATIRRIESNIVHLGAQFFVIGGNTSPGAPETGLIRVSGVRAMSGTTQPVPFPSAGFLGQLRSIPGLELTTWLDHVEGDLRWSWRLSGAEFPLSDTLAGAFGRAEIQRHDRPQGPDQYEAALFGSPMALGQPREIEALVPGIDALIAALPHARWTLMISAQSLPQSGFEAEHAAVHAGMTDLWGDSSGQLGTKPIVDEQRKILTRALQRLTTARPLGMWQVATVFLADDFATISAGCAALATAFPSDPSASEPVRVVLCARQGQAHPRANLLSCAELARLMQPPKREWPGFRRTTDVLYDLEPVHGKGPVWRLGPAMVAGAPSTTQVEIPLGRLTRHALISGTTGSGKTETVKSLLLTCQAARIPFMIVEPTKAEYRGLLHALAPARDGFRVYTPGVESPDLGFPLRLDPLDVPEGMPPGAWLDALLALFEAAFVLYAPMPYVLRAGISRLYSQYGWDIVAGSRGRKPRLSDLVRCCEAVVDEVGYDRKIASDVKAALRARLGTLTDGTRGPLYGSGCSTPDTELFSKPTIVELDALPRGEDKAFAMGLLMTRLWAWRRFGPGQGPTIALRHVLVLEEAHRLLRSSGGGGAGEEGGDTQAQAVEQLSDMLSEVRAYGEGVVIVDQVPTRLSEDAVKNTNLKISHRLVSIDDRECVGGASAMNADQIEHLVRLSVGEAVVFHEPMDRPMLVSVARNARADGPPVDLRAVGARMAGILPPKPFQSCRDCTLFSKPCGHIYGSNAVKDRADVRELATARAVQLLDSGQISGSMAEKSEPTAWCRASQGAADAVSWAASVFELEAKQTTALEQSVLRGGSFERQAGGSGPFAGCERCQARCNWRPLGARLTSDTDRWNTIKPISGVAERVVDPLVRSALRLTPNYAAARDIAFCTGVHEIEAASSPVFRSARIDTLISGLDAHFGGKK